MMISVANPVRLLLLMAGPLLLMGQAPSDEKVFSYPQDHISLSLPAGWTEMPASTLTEIRSAAKRAAGGLMKGEYRHGYLRPATAKDTRGAYMLIAFNPDNRLTERDLYNPERVKRGLGQALKKLDEKGAEINSSNTQFGDNQYDRERHLLWAEASGQNADVGPLRALSGTYLTSKGIIQVSCFTAAGDYASLRPEFQRIISSLRLDASVQYQPSFLDRMALPSGMTYERLFGRIGAILGALIGLAFAFFLLRRVYSRAHPAV